MSKILNLLNLIFRRDVTQSSLFINDWHGKMPPQLIFPRLTIQGESASMKKGLKGVSDKALTTIACVAGMVAALGGIFSATADIALDEDIDRLGDKVPDHQIQEIKHDKKSVGHGDSVFILAETGAVALASYSLGRSAGRKEKEKGPSR